MEMFLRQLEQNILDEKAQSDMFYAQWYDLQRSDEYKKLPALVQSFINLHNSESVCHAQLLIEHLTWIRAEINKLAEGETTTHHDAE